MANPLTVVNTYPLSNYTYLGTKPPKLDNYSSVDDRFARMKANYLKDGIMRRSVEAILVAHEHNHPHIIVFKIIGRTFFKLPGGRLRPGENEIEGLRRKLTSRLIDISIAQPDWQIGECVAMWWRPNFENVMYPYCPPHITKPKECKKLFIVHLPERVHFDVPQNLVLRAVPLFELYDNPQSYGQVLSWIPEQLSRFQFRMLP